MTTTKAIVEAVKHNQLFDIPTLMGGQPSQNTWSYSPRFFVYLMQLAMKNDATQSAQSILGESPSMSWTPVFQEAVNTHNAPFVRVLGAQVVAEEQNENLFRDLVKDFEGEGEKAVDTLEEVVRLSQARDEADIMLILLAMRGNVPAIQRLWPGALTPPQQEKVMINIIVRPYLKHVVFDAMYDFNLVENIVNGTTKQLDLLDQNPYLLQKHDAERTKRMILDQVVCPTHHRAGRKI